MEGTRLVLTGLTLPEIANNPVKDSQRIKVIQLFLMKYLKSKYNEKSSSDIADFDHFYAVFKPTKIEMHIAYSNILNYFKSNFQRNGELTIDEWKGLHTSYALLKKCIGKEHEYDREWMNGNMFLGIQKPRKNELI